MRKTSVFLGVVVFLLTFTSCLHSRQSMSVLGYRHGQVFLKKNLYYHVGILPDGWREFKTRAKAAAFHNDSLGATISTDAFCGAAFEDLPLKVLTGQLFAGTAKSERLKEEEFDLDGRGALRTVLQGEIDGVPLKFDSVVLKKNNCTVDFVYMVPPEKYDGGVLDFETFYKGFRF